MEERTLVFRYAGIETGVVLHRGGVPTNSESAVTVRMVNALDGTEKFAGRATTNPAAGTYEVVLTSADTDDPGLFNLVWSFEYDGDPATVVTFLEIAPVAPDYSVLDIDMQGLVESVWDRFADLYDSPLGGPHYQVYFQTRFGRARLARLLDQALRKLNVVSQPTQTYNLTDPGKFPLAKWGAVLEQALYIEYLKHLVRTYTEQPQWQGINIAFAERRDYMSRWKEVLDMETDDFTSSLEIFKIAHMGLGRARVLVAGGNFPNYYSERMYNPARPRLWARFL